jgi:glycosyltransferase involved in cell wall biosynthesis
LYGRVLEEIYSNAYFIVLPSEMEGLSFVVLESMAHGKTVLGSDIAANVEVLKNYGITFKSQDVDDLAKKLQLLFNYPQLVDDTGRRAKDFILQNYHWKDLTRRLVQLYRKK